MGVCTSSQSKIVHSTITVQPYAQSVDAEQTSWTSSPEDHQSKTNMTSSVYSPSPNHSLKKVQHHFRKDQAGHKMSGTPQRNMLKSFHKSNSAGVHVFSEDITVKSNTNTTQSNSQQSNRHRSQVDPKSHTVHQAAAYSQFQLRLPQKSDTGRSRKSILSEESSWFSQSTSVEYLSDEEVCMIDEINDLQLEKYETELDCKNTIAKIAPKKDDIKIRNEVQALLSLWEESGQLEAIEIHVHTTPADKTTDIAALAQYLTRENSKYMKQLESSQPHHVQLAKAYALFTWVCTNISFDVESFTKEEIGLPESSVAVEADETLHNRSSTAVGYANLFAALSKAAGLDSEVIDGIVSQFPTSTPTTERGRASTDKPHSWNAVKVSSTWFLLDCMLGASYLDQSTKSKHVYSRHYFATPPSHLILTHCPENEVWQQLETPVRREKLEKIIECPAYVFGMGIKPETWNRSIQLDENDTGTSISLKAKQSVKITAKLMPSDNDIQVSQENLVLLQRNGDNVTIRVVLPRKGNFVLTISAGLVEESAYTQQLVCLRYQIQSSFNPLQEIGYPIVHDVAAAAFDFRLVCWNQVGKDYVCESSSGDLNLAFTAEKDVNFSHYLIYGKTRDTNPQDKGTIYKYNSMIISDTSSSDEDKPLHMLKVVFPKEGWWTICLSGAKVNPDVDVQSGFTTLMSYQVYAQESKPKLTYPSILSSQVSFSQFDPIAATTESLLVGFSTTNPMDFHSFITFRQANGEPLDSFVQVLDLEKTVSSRHQYQLKIVFPKAGKWYVHVFGKEKESRNDELHQGLFRLLVYVEKPMDNAIIAQVNHEFTKQIQLTIADDGYTTFCDNGKPFFIDFTCDQPGITFQHQVCPADSGPQTASIETETMHLIDHCSYLAYPATCDIKAEDGSISPSVDQIEKGDQVVDSLVKTSQSLNQTVAPTVKLSRPYRLYASFPWAGRWIVELFAKLPDEECFTLAFHVNFVIKKPSRGVCYPKISPQFHELGLSIPDQIAAYNPICGTSEFELPFNAPGNLQFVWSIKLDGRENMELRKQGFIHQFGKRSPSHHFQLSFSERGIWTAQLFAKPTPTGTEKQDDTSTETKFLPVLEVSLQVQTIDRDVSFPLLYDAFTSFGLSIAKTHLPFISRVTSFPAKVVIPFFSTSDVKFWHRVEQSNGEDINMLTRMVSNSNTGLHELSLEVTEAGTYTISLWAQPLFSTDKDWEPVLCHTINCIT